MTKILFLDVDGVLNDNRTPVAADGFLGIDPFMVLLLDRIIQATGCKVVLSSSWRLQRESLEFIKKNVCDIYDITPYHKGLTSRGTEVKEWLEKNPTTDRFCCLDDNTDFLDGQKLFKTQFYAAAGAAGAHGAGLTEKIAQEVIDYLSHNGEAEGLDKPPT